MRVLQDGHARRRCRVQPASILRGAILITQEQHPPWPSSLILVVWMWLIGNGRDAIKAPCPDIIPAVLGQLGVRQLLGLGLGL